MGQGDEGEEHGTMGQGERNDSQGSSGHGWYDQGKAGRSCRGLRVSVPHPGGQQGWTKQSKPTLSPHDRKDKIPSTALEGRRHVRHHYQEGLAHPVRLVFSSADSVRPSRSHSTEGAGSPPNHKSYRMGRPFLIVMSYMPSPFKCGGRNLVFAIMGTEGGLGLLGPPLLTARMRN